MLSRFYYFLSIVFIVVLLSDDLPAQSLERFVFSSFGESVSSSGINFTYTVGEPITPTYFSTANNLILTQGFIQPEKSDISSVVNFDTQEGNFMVFPNPSAGSFTIQSQSNQPFTYQLHNTDGKLLFESNQLQNFGQHAVTIHAESLSQGIYYLRILDDHNRSIRNFKLIKINQ